MKSLFSIANRMFRTGKIEEAIGIYELLNEAQPEFPYYSFNETQARQKLAKQAGKEKAKNSFHLKSSSIYQKRLRIADLISTLDDPNLIDICFDPEEALPDNQHLLARANASIAKGYEYWLEHVNKYLLTHNLSPISIKTRDQWSGQHIYLNLTQSQLPAVSGPLVTICMSCFNAEPYVEHAVRSILNQSYQNIELLIYNDRSTDNSLKILQKLKKEDNRIKVIDNPINQGTYISRNQAFHHAKGDFFTIMDADDFALPERIAFQVSYLQQHPKHIGIQTEWVRMYENGRFHYKKGWGGAYQHEAAATLMIKTQKVREEIGYWDSVRFAADTEFLFRLRRAYGETAVPLLRIPTAISLFHEASLTNNPVTGIDINGKHGLSPTRKIYRESWSEWHNQSTETLYMPFPLKKRNFYAPDEMLPTPTTN